MQTWQENEEKKEYLKGYIKALKMECLLNDRLQQIRESKLFPSLQIDGMPHSRINSDLSVYAEKVSDLIEKIGRQKLECHRKYEEISEAISNMKDDTEKEVLMRRYILCEKWESIAVAMNYTYHHVIKIHGNALQHFKIPKHDTQ